MSEARTLWEEGREPGHRVVALGLALALSVAVVDAPLGSPEVGLLFDAAFVATCVGVALLVRPRDFFTVGVLPPLVMLAVLLLLALSDRAAVAASADDGLVRAVVAGLSAHAVALGVGYALCLALLAVRQQFLRATRA